MGILDPLFDGLRFFFETFARIVEILSSPLDGLQGVDVEPDTTDSPLDNAVDAVNPTDDLFTVLVEDIERDIIEPLRQEGQLTPDNVANRARGNPGPVDRLEGEAASFLAGVGVSATIVEAVGLGQLETHSEFLTQALAGLSITDVTGLELETRVSEGIQPALNARINRQHRAKFADLQDAIEQDLRNKDSDTGYIDDIATYGIRPDDVGILEEVALNAMEFEELIETPAELGLVVPDSILEAELDRSGYAEPTKEFLSQVNGRIRESARSYQELIRTEELVSDLDTLVEQGVIEPVDAAELVSEQSPADRGELQARFVQKRDQPAGAPSQTETVDAFVRGYRERGELRQAVDQREFPLEDFEPELRAALVDELDGSLQESVALGLLEPEAYGQLADDLGLSDEAVQALLAGQSFGDIVSSQLTQQADPETTGPQVILDIGPARASALEANGIETVAELAQASPDAVADAAGVSPETAAEFILRARQRTQ